MTFTLSYPGTRKRDVTFDERQEAIAAAYLQADEHTVEVHDDNDTLLVRYEKRATPITDQSA